MQLHGQTQTYSRYNVLAQATQPMDGSEQLLSKLAVLSQQKQWILFTSECPRPNFDQLSASSICCKNVIQMKPSQQLSEVEIVIKAIKSGNASAIVASNSIAPTNQSILRDIGLRYQCEVFFVEGRVNQYH
ncbi:Component of the SOS system and an inhibitor of cell division. Accumulation of SulA causes rapid cessation of cell division and the appearance of long [Vibrio sp. B1FLJ16]|uniref:SulA-like leucine-rich domain-containing protein n=1 Tax=Vibrio sp. B1FLJ16 TaxID=2751178 RepID=UPI0015F6CDE4|nr:SulA-like leucine-rich domain-containing protein [Vibrio sp. B1FLJ16]CAD7804342.1 Component of the SOS system and an inhibitor of cell division. Accumulation of SulA causes rapid cessation of cell division and the appearance of long [Vibrio sp. B1FLJ16]CAE6897133.1 Component of the SOS system and an inhibitor of cell division. Accumulation of SulA causes rapid cessation of cell division and the appearance of long [Vibrio sp. B1FLJ16]